LIVACACAPTHGEIVEIPLAEVCGPYPFGAASERTASFELDRPPIIVHGAWIRLSGFAHVGSFTCEDSGPYPFLLHFVASMTDSATGGEWGTSVVTPEETGPFELTAGFEPTPPVGTTWEFVADGSAELMLWGGPLLLVTVCWPITYPDAVVDQATLLLDAEFATPVESNTWGRIKALFRQQTRDTHRAAAILREDTKAHRQTGQAALTSSKGRNLSLWRRTPP